MSASLVRIRSCMPSAKKALLLSVDRFSNGSTAIDLAGIATLDACAMYPPVDGRACAGAGLATDFAMLPAGGLGVRVNCHRNPPPTASTTARIINSMPLTRWRPCSPWYQARIRVRTSPTQSARITSFSTSAGQPKRVATISTACNSAKANAT